MINSIQYLRFFAAFIVVAAHSGLGMYGITGRVTNLGGFGVDVFFVISGFIMPFIIYGPPSNEKRIPRYGGFEFLWLRISRIWPMYFLATMAVVYLGYMVANSMISDVRADFAYHFNGKMLDPVWIIESLTFTHGLNAPILGLGWTLQVEFIFYSTIAFLLLFTRTIGHLMIGLVLAFMAGNAITMLFPTNTYSTSYSNPMLMEFAYGFVIYSLLSKGIKLSKWIAIASLALSIPLFLILDSLDSPSSASLYYRALIWGGIAFIVVYAAISIEHLMPESKTLKLLGDSSYSLYLTHYTVVPVVVHYWTKYGLETRISTTAYLLLVLVLCHAVAVMVHLIFESPTNRLVRRVGREIQKFFR